MQGQVDITHILALILNRINITDFASIYFDIKIRKKIQKAIYILQLPKFNFNLGYRYNLYLAGPYSPGLSDDYYLIAGDKDKYAQLAQSLIFNKPYEDKIQDFNRIFDKNYERMECFSTLHFLITHSYAYIEDEKTRMAEAKKHLFRIKPSYSDINKREIVQHSLDLINKF